MGAAGSTSAHFAERVEAGETQLLDDVCTGAPSQFFVQSLVAESGGSPDDETDFVACQEDRDESSHAAQTMVRPCASRDRGGVGRCCFLFFCLSLSTVGGCGLMNACFVCRPPQQMMLGAGIVEGRSKSETQRRLLQDLITTLIGLPNFQSKLHAEVGLFSHLNALVKSERAPAELPFFRAPTTAGADEMPMKQLVLFALSSLLRASSSSEVCAMCDATKRLVCSKRRCSCCVCCTATACGSCRTPRRVRVHGQGL